MKRLVLAFLMIFIIKIGFCQQNISNQQRAEEFYERAIEFLQLQQPEKAKELLQLALNYDANSLKIHRLYQNLFPYKEIIDYYKKQYESNKGDPFWTYLYLRLVARDDPSKGCKMIFEAQQKFPNHPYLQLATSTCEVINLNWSAAEITLRNLLSNKNVPVEAYENMLRLYALENKTSMLLSVCKEGLQKFPAEASLYRLCLGYSSDYIPTAEKAKIIDKAYQYFSKSHQLAEMLFIYARTLKDDKEKVSYMKLLWGKYPNNRISSSIFPILWAQYSKEDKNELERLAKDSFDSERVGDAFMYTTAATHLVEIWKDNRNRFEQLLINAKVSSLNWQGLLILFEKLIENKLYIKNMEPLFARLVEEIKAQKNIAKDYLFRAYKLQAEYYNSAKDYKNAYINYKLAKEWQETLFTEETWLNYIELLDKLSEKKEIRDCIVKCFVYSLNENCLKYKDKYIKKEEFKNKVSLIRKLLYPQPIQFRWRTIDNKEISNSDLSEYNIFIIVYADSEMSKKLLESNKNDLEKLPKGFSSFLIILGEDQKMAEDFYKTINLNLPAVFNADAAQKLQIKGIPSIVILDAKSFIIYNRYINLENNKVFKIKDLINLIKIE